MKIRLAACLLTAMICIGLFTACTDHAARNNTPSDEEPAVITDVQAESYALNHVGLKTSEVSGLRSVYAYDNNTPHYEVHFYYNGNDYDMDVHAENGQVLSLDIHAHGS